MVRKTCPLSNLMINSGTAPSTTRSMIFVWRRSSMYFAISGPLLELPYSTLSQASTPQSHPTELHASPLPFLCRPAGGAT
jgi:hypothetical protein